MPKFDLMRYRGPEFPQRPISRTTARITGRKYYLTGRRCKRGHSYPRYTSSGNCVECHRLWDGWDRYNGGQHYQGEMADGSDVPDHALSKRQRSRRKRLRKMELARNAQEANEAANMAYKRRNEDLI